MLRAAAQRHDSPGAVLANVNDSLVPEIPPAMFVTCLYAIIDTEAGGVVLANAGHNLPYLHTEHGGMELRATGMPLGLMPGMGYDEKEYRLDVGEVMVLTSDGITEAHNETGEMYGFGRLMARVAAGSAPGKTVSDILTDLEEFTGPDIEQEDDITLAVIRRSSSAKDSAAAFDESPNRPAELLASFDVASREGNERLAIDQVTETLAGVAIPEVKLERLKTAIGETVMNAIEHANAGNEELTVGIQVEADERQVRVRVTDRGGGPSPGAIVTPDLEAKLTGEQTPRGWGLFLIEKMVDEMRTFDEGDRHVVELIVTREGGR
jgi:anti-sigma regulatory factor (Ser/Thr protein kinase)